MSTEIGTKMREHVLNEFWGGSDRGKCIQVTSISGQEDAGHIQLTMVEAATLAKDLSDFVLREAVRRQGLLKEKIKGMKEAEHTVFREICDLKLSDFITQELVVSLVDSVCPTVKADQAEQEEGK